MNKHHLIISFIILIIVIFSGCNENNNTNNNDSGVKPTIISFYITENIINQGETAELIWEVNNADLVSIDNGIGTVSLKGNKTISPINTTNYTLTASNGKQETYATVKIIVNQTLNKFVGTWKLDSIDANETLVIYNDRNARETIEAKNGTIYLDYYIWEDNGSILCLTHHINPDYKRCGSYEFSDDYNSFTWKLSNEVEYIYNKVN